MKLPLFWLNDYVDLSGVSVEELQNELLSSGFEVEEVIENGKDISNVVVGEVIECEPIEGTHLHVCKVDAGEHGVLQICCGADNVKVGIKAPCALVGATVYATEKDHKTVTGVETIKAGKLRGVDSFGMLCSGVELGVTEEMYKGAGYNGLLILDSSCENGADVKPILGLNEVIFDIGLTANRPDCQSILGMAREVSAILNRPLKMPDLSYKTADFKTSDEFKVTVEATDLCPRYLATLIKNIKIAPSPEWMQKRLNSVGIRAINNIVDITNFVLTEIGQPMHSFDYDLLDNRELIIRRAGNGEKITTLDDGEFTLNSENLVIADGKEPQCLAGIMGGKSSAITDDTRDVVFEAAMFKRDSIRRTSRALGKRSDSSSRFEKGTDAYIAKLGMERALNLVCALNAGTVAADTIDVLNASLKPQNLTTTVTKVNKVLGIDVPKSVIVDILTRLNFGVKVDGDALDIEVPPYRDDIEDYPDISEEVIRMYGYDNIIDTLLDKASITVGGLTKEQKDLNAAKNYMVSQGFSEAITYSFIGEKDYNMLGLDINDEKYRSVKILNPLGEDMSLMRTTLMPSMVKILVNNLNKKNDAVRLFEVAKTYIPKSLPLTELPVQNDSLSIGMYGDGEDFFTIKGVVEGLFEAIKASFKVDYVKCELPFMHPTRSANIVIGNKVIGYIGELNPVTAEKCGIEKRVYVGEIKYSEIAGMLNRKLKYSPIGRFPSVERDLALVMDESVKNGDVLKILKRGADKSLKSVELFDIYTGGQLEKGKKSMAYRLTFNLLERSLTLDEVDGFIAKILENLKKAGITLR